MYKIQNAFNLVFELLGQTEYVCIVLSKAAPAQEPTQQVRAESTQAAPAAQATEGQTPTAAPAAEQSQDEKKPEEEKKPDEEKKPQ